MIKLAWPCLPSVIEVGDNKAGSIIFENPVLQRSFLQDIAEQIAGNDGGVVLSKDGTTVNIRERVEMIYNFFNFDVNTKEVQGALVKSLSQTAHGEGRRQMLRQIQGDILGLSRDIALDLPYEINFGNPEWEQIVKMLAPKIEVANLTCAEQIFMYMRFKRELLKKSMFIFVNSRSFFSNNELETLLTDAINNEIDVLLVDNRAEELLEMEERLIIDKDQCEISYKADQFYDIIPKSYL